MLQQREKRCVMGLAEPKNSATTAFLFVRGNNNINVTNVHFYFSAFLKTKKIMIVE